MPQPVARNQQCLMIEADDRRYFTHEEHLPQLLEFCKSFDMSMSLVKVEAAPIHDLSDLPKAVCDAKKTPKVVFSLVRKILPFDPAICIPLVRTRSQILETAKAVREKIRSRFSKGEAVSRDMLEEEFPDATLTSATFMQHVRTARKELEEKGYQFERISPGCYRCITPEQQKAIEEEKKALDLLAQKAQPVWGKYKKTKPMPFATPPAMNFNYAFATPVYELGKKTPVTIHTTKPGDPDHIHAPIEPDILTVDVVNEAPAAPNWLVPAAEKEVTVQVVKNNIPMNEEFVVTFTPLNPEGEINLN